MKKKASNHKSTKNDSFGLKAVGLYVRVSTDRQVRIGESLKEQEEELRRYCDIHNHTIFKVYKEEGRSAKDTKRPQYRELVEDVKAGRLDAVAVKKIDRLSRSLFDFEPFVELLEKHGVHFISLSENFDTSTAIGKAAVRIVLVFSQLERETTSERVFDVMNFRASQGLHNGGYTPFGYTCIDSKWEINPQEKQIVELVFKTFLETRSIPDTVQYLEENKITTRLGKKWQGVGVRNMLKNLSYTGTRTWNDHQIPNSHFSIISYQTFKEAEFFLELCKSGQSVPIERSPFQKLLLCGECGSLMSLAWSLNRERYRYYYYKCPSSWRGKEGRCRCAISLTKIENHIKVALRQLTTPASVQNLEEEMVQFNQVIEERAKKFDQKILEQMNTLEALKSKNLSGQLYKTEIRNLEIEIARLAFDREVVFSERVELTELKKLIVECKNCIELTGSKLAIKLRSFVTTIAVYPNKLNFKFRSLPKGIDLNI